MIIRPLSDLGVLITRPEPAPSSREAQARSAFANRVRAAGGTPLYLPTLAIEPRAASRPALDAYQTLIFISRNAVLYGLEPLGGAGVIEQARTTGLVVAAVGQATAAALAEAGVTVDCFPEQQASSEALLAEPALQAAGPKALIVRGEGGRETLALGLRARGTDVDYLEAYARVPLPWTHPRTPVALLAEVDVILATSVEVLAAFTSLVADVAPGLWQNKGVVVGSARMIPEVKRLGFTQRPRVATQPTDDAMFAALLTGQWPTRARSASRNSVGRVA